MTILQHDTHIKKCNDFYTKWGISLTGMSFTMMQSWWRCNKKSKKKRILQKYWISAYIVLTNENRNNRWCLLWDLKIQHFFILNSVTETSETIKYLKSYFVYWLLINTCCILLYSLSFVSKLINISKISHI